MLANIMTEPTYSCNRQTQKCFHSQQLIEHSSIMFYRWMFNPILFFGIKKYTHEGIWIASLFTCPRNLCLCYGKFKHLQIICDDINWSSIEKNVVYRSQHTFQDGIVLNLYFIPLYSFLFTMYVMNCTHEKGQRRKYLKLCDGDKTRMKNNFNKQNIPEDKGLGICMGFTYRIRFGHSLGLIVFSFYGIMSTASTQGYSSQSASVHCAVQFCYHARFSNTLGQNI